MISSIIKSNTTYVKEKFRYNNYFDKYPNISRPELNVYYANISPIDRSSIECGPIQKDRIRSLYVSRNSEYVSVTQPIATKRQVWVFSIYQHLQVRRVIPL